MKYTQGCNYNFTLTILYCQYIAIHWGIAPQIASQDRTPERTPRQQYRNPLGCDIAHYCNVRDHRLHPLGCSIFQYCNQMFAFLQFVAIFSNTATKFQNISNFVANLVAVLENIARKLQKTSHLVAILKNTATEGVQPKVTELAILLHTATCCGFSIPTRFALRYTATSQVAVCGQ